MVSVSVTVDETILGVVGEGGNDSIGLDDPIFVVVLEGVFTVVEIIVVPLLNFTVVPDVEDVVQPNSSSWFGHCALPSHFVTQEL